MGRVRNLHWSRLNEITEHRYEISDRIKERMEIFGNAIEDIDVGVFFIYFLGDVWNKVDEKLTGIIKSMIDDNIHNGWSYISCQNEADYEDIVEDDDAYYGSASPIVLMFSQKKKPVMIADYNI